ncbi:hypothetical protein ACFQ1L_45450 [Phytohabitans flavus]|uniref:hypothetical protein n=1 Tax=Phytohabitans flavus TaxID=1076124 RepID=UPI00363BF8E6
MSVVASAAELHAQSVRETEHGRHAEARRLLRAALRSGPEPELRARILISLAYHQAERRSLDDGLALLGEADEVPDLPPRLRGMVAAQRGLLFMRAGRSADALSALDAAVGLLDESVAEDICRPLLTRGILQMQRGVLTAARADFRRCVEIAGRHGLDMLAAKASHNLGYLSLLSGALPQALRDMDAVWATLAGQSPTYAAVCHIDRAQVLLAAGLWREADDDLAHAVDLFAGAKAPQDQAEAELTRAQVALLEERHTDARRLAERARKRFVARGADTWALLAEHMAVAAAVAKGKGAVTAAEDAARVATALATAGLDDDARRATLTGVAALLAVRPLGSVEEIRAAAGDAIRLRRDDPIATRLAARSVRATLADAEGSRGGPTPSCGPHSLTCTATRRRSAASTSRPR